MSSSEFEHEQDIFTVASGTDTSQLYHNNNLNTLLHTPNPNPNTNPTTNDLLYTTNDDHQNNLDPITTLHKPKHRKQHKEITQDKEIQKKSCQQIQEKTPLLQQEMLLEPQPQPQPQPTTNTTTTTTTTTTITTTTNTTTTTTTQQPQSVQQQKEPQPQISQELTIQQHNQHNEPKSQGTTHNQEVKQLQQTQNTQQMQEETHNTQSPENLVLVVDDNRINQKVLSKLLELQGLSVVVCGDGEECIKECSSQKFQIIFMDCHMPKMDGYTATETLRNTPGPNSQTPIVALTADANESNQERCLGCGMNAFLTKPIRKQHLQTVLHDHLPPS